MSEYEESLAEELDVQMLANVDEYGAYGFLIADEEGGTHVKFKVCKEYIDRLLNPLDFVAMDAKRIYNYVTKLEESLGRALEKDEFLHGYISQLALLAMRSGALSEEEAEQVLTPTREQFALLAEKLFEIPED